ncbi:hypothetical protein ACFL96_19500 [Thermoproteota archaeon]
MKVLIVLGIVGIVGIAVFVVLWKRATQRMRKKMLLVIGLILSPLIILGILIVEVVILLGNLPSWRS